MAHRTMFVVVVILAAAMIAGATWAAEVPKGFRLEPVLTGLTDPSSLDKLPDGTILITERTTGDVREVRGGELQPNPVCTVSVTTGTDEGLLGIAVHPDFERTRWIYLYYTTDAVSPKAKVTRYTLGPGGCGSPLDILADLSPISSPNLGGGIAFGPDGKLYVGVGDLGDSANGQNDSTNLGKILRINDNGTVPSDNPNPGSLVYSKGVRDPRGVAVNDAGQVYADDADAAAPGDELNAVAAGGNLGWDTCTSPSCESPVVTWDPAIGVTGLAVYGATAFPDQAADGLDNDEDKWGPDRFPGVFRTDDDGDGVCVGSDNNEQLCTSDADCPPRVEIIFTEDAHCEFRDETDEWCPGGVAYGDDGCDGTTVHGVDEPDESFLRNLFTAAGDRISRTVLQGASLDQLFDSTTFVDSTFLPDCPTGWSDVMTGRDGFLYALATNGGGAGGGLYRIIHDEQPGPREVSKPGSHVPLRVGKGAVAGDVDIYWEDLREDATQPRDDGVDPLPPQREYTVWMGTLGNFYSHSPVSGLDATPGTAVNDAVRKATVATTPGEDLYFLVSARHANLEGTLGVAANGERPGYSVTDLCQTIGYHEAPNYDLWKCGQDFTLRDEHGQTHSLYEYREKVVMLDLSAMWCPPCKSEADALENLNQDYKDRGVQVLTVLMDETFDLVDFVGRPTPEDCRDWEDRPDPNPDHTFPCWVDPNPDTGGTQQAWPKYDKWGAIPTNVILDTGLRVVYSGAGWDETTIRAKLDKLVGTTDVCLP